MKKLKLFLVSMLLIFVFTNNYTYASFADYTDEDAEKDTQTMIEEHKENFDSTKSDNNYLKELKVNGWNISPNFDRQVVEYSVEVGNTINEIDIVSVPEDNKATVKGNGKIDIRSVSECRIEVVAESGTTRTYFIKINKQSENNKTENNENNENTIKNEFNDNNVEIVNSNNIIEENAINYNKQKNNNKYIIIGGGIVFFIFIIFLFSKLKSKKSKH